MLYQERNSCFVMRL